MQTRKEKGIFRLYYLVYYLTGLLETLLLFRFALKLLGANPTNGFVDFMYSITDVFVTPFEGVFSPSISRGAETVGVFDPAILIAMVVYGLLGWGIAKLIDVLTAGRTSQE